MILSTLKNITTAIVVLIATIAVTSCDVTVDDKTPSNRTILVYMAAANSLSGADTSDLAEMKAVAGTQAVKGNRLIVFHQNRSGNQVLKEVNLTTGNIDTLKIYDNSLSSVSIERMRQVIMDTEDLAPAYDYGLILWSHGNGWIVTDSSPNTRDLSSTKAFGEENLNGSSKYMNIDELATALNGFDFSFVYFDACYMGSVEVMYELRNSADYIIASSTETIVPGMPYDIGLPYLFAPGHADLEGAVNAIYNYVNTAYTGTSQYYNQTGTYALCKMSEMENLASRVRTFYSFHPVAPIDFKPQPFMYESTCYFFDLQDILENLQIDTEDSDLIAAFEAARLEAVQAISDVVVYKKNTEYIWPGHRDEVKLDKFCGLSTYFVKSGTQAVIRGYDTTSWWNDVARYQFQ